MRLLLACNVRRPAGADTRRTCNGRPRLPSGAAKHTEFSGARPWARSPKGRKARPTPAALSPTNQMRCLANGDAESFRRLVGMYHQLSQVAHPRAGGLSFQYTLNGGGTEYHLAAGFREDDARWVYDLLIAVAVLCSDVVGGFVRGRDPSWAAARAALQDDTLAWQAARRAAETPSSEV